MIKQKDIDNKDFFDALLDAVPIPVLVVNSDVQVLYYNSAAAVLVGSDPEMVIRRRTGEVLHCIHSREASEGCGYTSFCRDCIIRNSVKQAFLGRKVSQKLLKMEMLKKNNVAKIYLRITTAPVQYGEEQMVMVLLEDVSELNTLRQMLPICSRCKKVRDDQAYWQHLDEYLNTRLDVDFTHSLCPRCADNLYPGISSDNGNSNEK